jgi:hypothetical protein
MNVRKNKHIIKNFQERELLTLVEPLGNFQETQNL